MKADVLLGLQWGDEGKGKIVDFLAPRYDIVVRYQGGPNAGHTITISGGQHVLHSIPSGIFHPGIVNVIGNGVVLDPWLLEEEIRKLGTAGVRVSDNLLISRKAHLILPSHRLMDAVYEAAKGKAKIGSTLKGIGPAYTDKPARNGLRAGDTLSPVFRDRYNALKKIHFQAINSFNLPLHEFRIDNLTFDEYEARWLAAAEALSKRQLADTEYFLNHALDGGKRLLAEGAQGTLLDVDFGSYPFVTSSSTVSAGACTGTGLAPSRIGKVFGVFKAYCTRVGSGPFPTELDNETGEKIRQAGREFGATTGRPRRCGWLDLPALKYALMLNGVTHLFMMKADVLNDFSKINVCTAYECGGKQTGSIPFDLVNEAVIPSYRAFPGWKQELQPQAGFAQLPENFRSYAVFIEQQTGVPVSVVSLGPDRNQTVFRDASLLDA